MTGLGHSVVEMTNEKLSNGKCSFLFLLNDPQQMRHLRNHSAHRRRIRTLDDLIKLPQAQAADDFFLLRRTRNRTSIVLNANRGRRNFLLTLFFRNHTTKVPRPAFRASGPPRMDLSSLANHRTSPAQRCADWSIPGPLCAHLERRPPALPPALRHRQ